MNQYFYKIFVYYYVALYKRWWFISCWNERLQMLEILYYNIVMPIETLVQIKSQILQMSIIQSGLRSVVIYFITWIWSVTWRLFTMTSVSKLNQAHYRLSSSHSTPLHPILVSWWQILNISDLVTNGCRDVWALGFSAFKDEFKKVDLYSFGRSPIM